MLVINSYNHAIRDGLQAVTAYCHPWRRRLAIEHTPARVACVDPSMLQALEQHLYRRHRLLHAALNAVLPWLSWLDRPLPAQTAVRCASKQHLCRAKPGRHDSRSQRVRSMQQLPVRVGGGGVCPAAHSSMLHFHAAVIHPSSTGSWASRAGWGSPWGPWSGLTVPWLR